MILSKISLALAAFSGLALAHPGHDHADEVLERRRFIDAIKRADLSHCAEHLVAKGVVKRNAARRAEIVEKARGKRGLKSRDLGSLLGTDHDRSELGYTPETSPDTLFGGSTSCLLSPEVIEGPYYVGGEFIRKDVTDGQTGVSLLLDYQVIDVDTCDPIPDMHLEIWHCNATGVYSGVVANGNGNINDQGNIDATFLRGIQKTDADGVAQFESIFPGHYIGRAVHTHILVHANAEAFPNGTLGNSVTASHMGQAYFDQSLIDTVEKTSIYSGNTQPSTPNSNDFVLAQQATTEGVDPIHEYVLLGDDVSDGLFAWLAFGISKSYSRKVEPAVNFYESGGVKNPNANGGMGPGFPGGFPGGPGGRRQVEDQ